MTRPTAIYSAAQVRALDAFEIDKRRVPGYTLMTRAAYRVASFASCVTRTIVCPLR